MWAPEQPRRRVRRGYRALAQGDGATATEVLVATKVRGAMGANGSEGRAHPLQREGLSRRWIMQACEDSLKRLQTDHIDLYQVHWVDAQTPIEETLSALTDLVRTGYVRYLGCSNFSAWRLMQALWTSDKHGFERFVSIQPGYSLTQPTRADFERELARVCETYGVGVLPYSPLAGGFLTGKYERGAALPDSKRAEGIADKRFTEQNWNILDVGAQRRRFAPRSPGASRARLAARQAVHDRAHRRGEQRGAASGRVARRRPRAYPRTTHRTRRSFRLEHSRTEQEV